MSKAVLKFIRLSPNKARLVAREVQGMNGEVALAALEFTPNKAAGIISKVIASAIANGGFEPEEVEIVSCRVDKGPVLRRFKPRARGSASKILKPTSHIMVEVAEAGAKKAKTETPKADKVEKPAAKKVEAKKEEPKVETEAKKITIKRKAKDLNDLAALSGVGPALVKKLNEDGINTLNDIVNMDADTIVALDEKHSIKGKVEESWKAEASLLIENLEKES